MLPRMRGITGITCAQHWHQWSSELLALGCAEEETKDSGRTPMKARRRPRAFFSKNPTEGGHFVMRKGARPKVPTTSSRIDFVRGKATTEGMCEGTFEKKDAI